ncbi:MAG TPA: hypothetical protein VJU81_25795 [Methylomirabilota bacterium]|nr:hypothetical protein [Methylomirabilota bacterium]
MAAPDLNLVLHLAVPDADLAQLEQATARLRREVRDLPVANVGPVVATSAPTGAKSGPEAVAIGAIAVSLAPHVIAPLFDLLKGWMNRNPGVATKIKYQSAKGDQVELEFDPERMSREEIAGLVETLRKG